MWMVISTMLLKMKDFSRSQAVMYTVRGNISEMVQDKDVLTMDH